MKPFSTLSVLMAVLMATAVLLSGCSTTSSQPSDEGTSSSIVWPKAADAWPSGGTFPNLDNLRLLSSGMTKDQLYNLVGRPHFNEGMLGVREWDYLFNFRTNNPAPNDVVQCQMKVLFDKDVAARSYYWAPESCAARLRKSEAPAPTVASMPMPVAKTTTLSTDVLFAFDRAGANDLLPEGRKQIRALGAELAGMKQVSRVEVVAYTDRLGSDAYNQRLSKARAETVRGLLVQQGVDSQVVFAHGAGKGNPVSNCGAMPKALLINCLAPDRRVEIRSMGLK